MDGFRTIRFDRFGRTLQLRIHDADDLRKALELDEAHWVATSAPISTLRADATLLSLVDADKNGRVRVREMKDAIEWLLRHLKDDADVSRRRDTLRLDAINTDVDTGGRIDRSARKILNSLDKPDTAEISLEDVRTVKARIEATPVSEAGVVLPEAAEAEHVRKFLSHIIATVGGAPHPSGGKGVNGELLKRFVSQAAAHLAWHERGHGQDGQVRAELSPLGPQTAEAFGLVESVRQRLEQFFTQCEAMAFDDRLAGELPPRRPQLAQVDLNDPDQVRNLLSEAPPTAPNAEGVIDFNNPLNPIDRARLESLRDRALAPLLGGPIDRFTQAQWKDVLERFRAYESWTKAKPGPAVAGLGLEQLRTYCEPAYAEAVNTLIAGSRETTIQLDNVRLVEKLVLYQSSLIDLANNFVSFPQLYDLVGRAMFETGCLVMDGRRFDLAVKVENRAEHTKVTQTSDMFVLYVQLERVDLPSPREVAVPVTAGGRGNLVVGKRGIFFDIDGREWDARVVQMIENPISFTEAIIAPFKRIGRLIGGKIEQMTGAAEKELDQTTQQALTQVETTITTEGAAPAAPPAAPQAAQNRGLLAGGVLAGGGLAVAALGSAVAFITKTLAGLNWWTIVAGLGGAVLALLLPSMVLAFIKLRRRDLSTVLEGSGWAINARMRLTRRQSHDFTKRPPYPRGARGVRRLWWWLVLIGVVLALVAASSYYWYQQKQKPTSPPPAIEAPPPAAAPPAEQPAAGD